MEESGLVLGRDPAFQRETRWPGNPLTSNPGPIESICEKFSEFLTNTLGTKQICRRTKRWWTPEVNEAHALMGKARASLRNRQISAQEFKNAQKTWFHTIRKAKRTSWTTFLQEGKGGGHMEGYIGEARTNANEWPFGSLTVEWLPPRLRKLYY
jgi:hypothetical protein